MLRSSRHESRMPSLRRDLTLRRRRVDHWAAGWRGPRNHHLPSIKSQGDRPRRLGSAGARHRRRTGAPPAAADPAPARRAGMCTATDHHRDRNWWQLIDQPGAQARAQPSPARRHSDHSTPIAFHARTSSTSKLRAQLCARGGHLAQRRRVHDLVGRLPDRGVVVHHLRLVGEVHRLPELHDVVQPTAAQVGADRTLQVVDERVHFFVGSAPPKSPVTSLT